MILVKKIDYARWNREIYVKSLLDKMNRSDLYLAYRGMCQIVHGEPEALSKVIRKREDGHVLIGYLMEYSDWGFPFQMATWGLVTSAPFVFQKMGVTHELLQEFYNRHDAFQILAKKLSSVRSSI
jgi:hypothetical protein